MLQIVGRPEGRRWTVSRRNYFLKSRSGEGEWDEGVAEKVRAERKDGTAWIRVLEAVFWWPMHEGKEWPGVVVPAPEWLGAGPEPDTWGHFEATVGMTSDRFRWEATPEVQTWPAASPRPSR
jgi:hypothetical protein